MSGPLLISPQMLVSAGRRRSFSSLASYQKANIALIGAGWWSQGWHLPQLSRNEKVSVAAIVDASDHPVSSLDPHLEPLTALAVRYDAPLFSSTAELLENPLGSKIDGAIVCTPHATHYQIAKLLIEEGMKRSEQGNKPINILIEKPMTTNVHEAKKLHDLVSRYQKIEKGACFLVNHSANYITQTQKARELVESGDIGDVRHVTAFMASPLSWIFENPQNIGWNEPTGDMLGNGFTWGQSSHLLAWIYHVAPSVCPERVFCVMNHSNVTGADVSHAATVSCSNDITFSLSGTSLLPGHAHSDPPVGKRITIKIFGTNGALLYSGDDRDSTSGLLELRSSAGELEVPCKDLGFDFEDTHQEGYGPESLQSFIDACLGDRNFYVGASSGVGLRTVQTIDAMYRSHVSGNAEDVLYR